MGKVLIFKDADFSQNAIDGDKDYVLVNSITFDGSHYINLGRGLTQQSKIELCFTPTTGATGSQKLTLCGVRSGANLNQVDIRIIYDNGNKLQVHMVNDENNPGFTPNMPLTINTLHTVTADIKNNNIILDGEVTVNERNVSGLNTGNNNLYIGAYNANGEIPSAFSYYIGKIHWIKIYDNSNLTNYYAAATVKETGVRCLVDRLHDENKYYLVS